MKVGIPIIASKTRIFPWLFCFAFYGCGDVATVADQAAVTSANYRPVSLANEELLPVTVNLPYKEILKTEGGLLPFSFKVTKGAIPPGLKLDPVAGVFSGIVTDSEASKQFSMTISVTDMNGVTDEQTFTLKVNRYTYEISPTELPSVVLNQPYQVTLSAIGGVKPFSWQIAGEAPSGFQLDPVTGILKIDPNSPSFALKPDDQVKINIKTQDKNGVEVNKIYAIGLMSVGYQPVKLGEGELLGVVPDASYKETIPVSGGALPLTFKIVKGDLPKGLEFNTTTGTISGKVLPTSLGNLQYVLQIQVTDAYKKTDEKIFRLQIKPYSIVLTPADLPDVIPMTPYGIKLGTVGGVPPFTFSAVGDLPTRLKVSAEGIISTTAPHVPLSSANSEWPIDLSVTDSQGITGRLKTKIKVGAAPANSAPLTIQNTSLATVVAGASYSAGVMATGGVAPIKFKIQSGSLPQGLQLDENTGLISGTAAVSTGGTQYAVIIRVTDATQDTLLQSYSGTVSLGSSVLKILSQTISTPTAGGLYSSVIAVTGGQEPYVFSLTSGTLPQGLSLNTTNGTLSGTVAAGIGGNGYLFAISVTDATQQTASKTYSGTIQSISSPLTIQTSALANMVAGTTYSSGISVTGGVAPITFAVDSGTLPTGLSLAPSTGNLSGSLAFGTANSTYAVVISATDATGQKVTRTYTGSVGTGSSLLSITTTSLTSPNAGASYAGVISVTGGVTPYQFSVTSGTLPTGISLNTSTGVISGVPSFATANTAYVFTITVTDASGQTASRAYSGTIGSAAAPLAVQTPSIVSPVAGSSYLQMIAATGGVSPYTFSVSSGTLPSGLSINANSGMISGTVSFGARNNPYLFSITVTDSNSNSAVQTYSGFVGDYSISMLPTTLPTGTPASFYTTSIVTVGGQSPYVYSISTGTLPSGLTFNTVSGEITGTIADSEAGLTRTFVVTSTDAHGATTNRTYSLATASFVVTLNTASLAQAVEGQTYTNNAQNLSASGGTSPYTFEYSGNLPSGVGLTSAGEFFGTPALGTGALTTGTNYPITIRVRDSANRVSQAYSRTINVGLSVPQVGAGTPPVGVLGTAYAHSLSASGGRPPYTYSLMSGSLPSGLSLQSSGAISGTPTAAVSCPAGQFDVRVRDALNQDSALSTKCLATVAGVSITSLTFPTIVTSVNYAATLTATGGTTPYTFAATGLPSGISLNPTTGALSGFVNTATGDFTVYFTVTDSSTPALSTTQAFTLKVRDPLVITTTAINRAGSGIAYNAVTFASSGGQTPYTYSLSSGSLPSGLSLSSAGVLSGTPAQNSSAGSGTYTFSVIVSDASGLQSPAKSFTLYVTRGPKITTKSIPTALENRAYSYQIEHTGGVNTFINSGDLSTRLFWGATGLPSGLSINSSTGRITGTPSVGSAAGSPYSVTLSVKDQHDIIATKTVTMKIRTTGITFDSDLPRSAEPCPSGSIMNCEPIAHAVGALVPATPNTKYMVYGAVTAGTTTTPTSSFIYIARIDSQGNIATPGTSNFTVSYALPSQGWITGLDLGDIDNDGFIDIVYSDRTNNTVVVVWNSGTTDVNGMPVFSSQNAFNMPASGNRPHMVKVRQLRPDPTNSNKKDLAVVDYDLLAPTNPARMVVFLAQNSCSTNCSASRSTVYTGTGASITAYSTTLVTPALGLAYIGGMDIGYFDVAPAAGVCPSLVISGRRVSGSSDDYLYLRRQSFSGGVCTGNFSTHVASDEKLLATANYNHIPSHPAIADFNKDGISDIAVVFRWSVANLTNSNSLKVYLMPGSNLFPTNPLSPLLPYTSTTSHIGGSVIPYCADGSTTCDYPGLLVAGGRDRAMAITGASAVSYGFLSFIPNQGSSPWFEDNTGNNRIDYEGMMGIGINGITATPIVTSNKNDIVFMGIDNNAYPYYFMAVRNGSSTSDPFKLRRMLQSLPTYLATAAEVGTLKLIDINNDGTLEIISHLINTSAISIISGNTSTNVPASIPEPTTNPIGSNYGFPTTYHYPATMDVGDFNEDGYPDFATVGNASRVVTVNFGDGTTTIGNSIMLEPGVSGDLYPRIINVDDYDNDGHDDIMIYNHNNTQNNYSMAFFKGQGNGSFSAAQEFFQGSGVCGDARSMVSKDLNGDGRPEIAVLCYASQALWILRRHADAGGTWIKNSGGQVNTGGGANGTNLAIGYLSSTTGIDVVVGGLDIVNSYRIISGMQLSAPDANGNFTVSVSAFNGYQPLRGYLSHVEITDLDEDGYGDLILTPGTQGGNAAAAVNSTLFYTCHTFSAGNCNRKSWGGYGSGMAGIAVGDMNGDGLNDFVIGTRNGGKLPYRMILRGFNTGQ